MDISCLRLGLWCPRIRHWESLWSALRRILVRPFYLNTTSLIYNIYLVPERRTYLAHWGWKLRFISLRNWSWNTSQLHSVEMENLKGGLIKAGSSSKILAKVWISFGYRLSRARLTVPEVTAHFGGIGIYASMRDYLSLLRHLLQILGMSISDTRQIPIEL